MQIYLCKAGDVSGPFTTDQLHRMRENKEIDTNMLYWCEGMQQWEKFHPAKDLKKITAIKDDACFPFETGKPPPAPWQKTNIFLRVYVIAAIAACLLVFALAWKKHSEGARAEVTKSLMVLSSAEKYQSDIKQGEAYTQEMWPEAAAAAGITDIESAQDILGTPNQINDGGYRWIYFDRMIHPVTGMKTDMSVRFDEKKKISGFAPYP